MDVKWSAALVSEGEWSVNISERERNMLIEGEWGRGVQGRDGGKEAREEREGGKVLVLSLMPRHERRVVGERGEEKEEVKEGVTVGGL